MDEWGFFSTAQQFIDPVAVIFAITACWLIKQIFFQEAGQASGFMRPGEIWTRIFPAMPILLAVLYVVVTGYKSYTGNVLASKGIVSGAVAGYLNRAWKVVVLGQ
jgi:hypothetical protein